MPVDLALLVGGEDPSRFGADLCRFLVRIFYLSSPYLLRFSDDLSAFGSSMIFSVASTVILAWFAIWESRL